MLWPHSWWTQVRHCRKRTWFIRKEVSCCFCFFPTTTVTSPTCVLLHLHVCNGSHVVDLPPLGPTFRKNAEQMRKGLDKSRHHGAAISMYIYVYLILLVSLFKFNVQTFVPVGQNSTVEAMSKTAPLTAEVRCACMWLRHHWLWECVWFCWGVSDGWSTPGATKNGGIHHW
jgi:hypothetical protein